MATDDRPFSPGLEGVIAGDTALGFVDGERGVLLYRGYRIGDLVDIPLGLKLSAVAAHQLTFTDEKGNDYVKNF